MKRLLSSLFLVFLSLVVGGRVMAQDGGTNLMYTDPNVGTQPSPPVQDLRYDDRIEYYPESHSYTFNLKEDGTASVWFRIDGVVTPKEKATEYRLTLPDNVKGDVSAWFRENGLVNNNWTKITPVVKGRELVLAIPARKILKPQDNLPITIGVSWNTSDITTKKWWGRELRIASATSDQVMSYLAVGVNMPDGVDARDKQQGPGGWSQAIGEMMAKDTQMTNASRMSSVMSPSVFDMAGSGQINRSKNNLAPGEEYSFKLMTATSAWKLYVSEILWGLVWILAIAIVLTLLLYMIVGKKSFAWYGLVVLLLMTLFVLVSGLWLNFRYTIGGGMEFSTPGSTGPTDPGLAPEPVPSDKI